MKPKDPKVKLAKALLNIMPTPKAIQALALPGATSDRSCYNMDQFEFSG